MNDVQKLTIFVGGTLFLLVAHATLLAQTPPEGKKGSGKAAEEAKEHFKKGTQLFNEGKYVSALEEFKRSYDLSPRPIVLYNIGICEYFLFQYGAAMETLKKYLAEATKADPKKRAKVEELIKEMEKKSARLIVVVEPADAAVVIDGKKSVATPMEEHILLDPGEHTIEVKKEGFVGKTERITLKEGAVEKVTIRLDKLPALEETPAEKPLVKDEEKGPQEAVLPEEEKKGKPLYKKAWFWSIIGAVVASGAGVGIYFGATHRGRGPEPFLELRPR